MSDKGIPARPFCSARWVMLKGHVTPPRLFVGSCITVDAAKICAEIFRRLGRHHALSVSAAQSMSASLRKRSKCCERSKIHVYSSMFIRSPHQRAWRLGEFYPRRRPLVGKVTFVTSRYSASRFRPSRLDSGVFRQRLALGLRQERRRREAEEVDAGEDHRRLAIAAELHDQRAREQRAKEGDEARRIEHERNPRAARARGKQLRQPYRHPGILSQREERVDASREQQQVQVLGP